MRGADRLRRDPVRPAQRRRQGLGPLSALPRPRLRGRGSRAGATSRSAPPARASAPPPSTSRAGSARPPRVTARRPHGRRARRRQRLRQRQCRRRAAFLGGAVRAGRRVRRRGLPATCRRGAVPIAGRPGENTTIALVATDAALTKAQAKRLAVMAQDGLARAIYPGTPRSTATSCSRPRPGAGRSAIAVHESPNSGRSPPTCSPGRWLAACIRGHGAARGPSQLAGLQVSGFCANNCGSR